MDLALNNLQRLIKPNQPTHLVASYMHTYVHMTEIDR